MAGKVPMITGFLIALTLFGFFVGMFGLLYSDMEDKYGVDYKNESLAVYNKLDEMHTEAESYQKNITKDRSEMNFIEKGVDIAGGIFRGGISSVKITFNSVTVFLGMADAAQMELSQAGVAGMGYLKKTMITIVLILFFVGILLPIILRRLKM